MKPRHTTEFMLLTATIGAIVLLSSSAAEAKKRRSGSPSSGEAKLEIPEPQIGPGIASNDRFTFGAAFRTALKRLHERGPCGELFSGLNFDGIRALRLSHYGPVQTESDQKLCRGGVVAVTGVGTGQTRLCGSFSRLSRNAKAALIIHEALHAAGMSEAPDDPEAPTSLEITTMVKAACAL